MSKKLKLMGGGYPPTQMRPGAPFHLYLIFQLQALWTLEPAQPYHLGLLSQA
jgi:hypothetical protein